MWKKGKLVKTKNNINTEIGIIKKGTIGKIIEVKFSFLSNSPYYDINFNNIGTITFTNYDKKYFKLLN